VVDKWVGAIQHKVGTASTATHTLIQIGN
jgi:hypothetical protein